MHLSIQNKTRIAFALVAFLMVYTVWNGWKSRNDELRFKVRGDRALVYGTTDQFSLGTMREFIRDNPEVETLVLHRMSGTVDGATNLQIAREIRNARLNTHLVRNSYIASGAVDLFIAGTERTMDCGALIGVHSWSWSIGKNERLSPKEMGFDRSQRSHENFLREMGVDPALYVFTRDAAEPEDIYIMKEDEIERYGLLTDNRGCR